jgi:hypothetical protein
MEKINVRVTVAILAFTTGVVISQLVNTSPFVEYILTYLIRSAGTISLPKASVVDSTAFNNLPTQIILKRVYSGCTDCRSREIVLRTDGVSEFEDAAVTEVDFHTRKQRCGRLPSYDYQELVQLIESQGYFEVAQQYDMQWIDGTFVTSTVAMRRPIVTASPGEIPTRVWGLLDVEDVSAKVNWENGNCTP